MSELERSEVGYCQPPAHRRFAKGKSGNPRGRPPGRRKEIPYDWLLGQMVTVREDGRERRITAAEAFLLQLTKRGLEGCSASARASLTSIELARAAAPTGEADQLIVKIVWRTFGLCCVIEDLGMAVRLNPTDKGKVRLELRPWIVQAAVDRMAPHQLLVAEQAIVVASTRTPSKVRWPDWWVVR